MARAKWKNKFFSFDLWRSITRLKQNFLKKLFRKKKFYRSSSIPKCFLNNYINIHKGKIYKKLLINKNIIGLKFGEFALSKKPFFFPKKIIKKSKKR
jgi:ribosomal protein S19